LNELEKQVLPYLIQLAESSPVQAELEAAKVAIINIVEKEAGKAVPYGLKTISRLIRWIYAKFKKDVEIMAGIAKIIVNDGTNILEGVTIDYVVSNMSCTATTDSTGVATIEGLDAGSYEIKATLSGYTSASITLTVTDDTTVTGTISLTKETTTTTEEESTVSTSTTTAAEEAAATAAAASLVSSGETIVTSTSDGLSALIKTLSAEIATTSSPWVKIRNSVEIAALAGALAGITAGLTTELKKLAK